MKTITIKVTEQEQDTFARAKGYTDTIINEETGEEVAQDIDVFTENAIESIFKNDSIRYTQKEARRQAEEQIAETVEGIRNTDIDISIT